MKGVTSSIGKKDNGFVSIERSKEAIAGTPYSLVFRNFIGSIVYSGLLLGGNKCKVKEETENEQKFKVKVGFLAKD